MWQQNGPPKGRSTKKNKHHRSSIAPPTRSKGLRLHIKRVGADIRLVGVEEVTILQGRLILNDLSPKGFQIFSTVLIPNGQEVAITLEEPKGLYLRGKVVSGQDFNATSHILTSSEFKYRMMIRLLFDSPEDEQRMREFCLKLTREELLVSAEDDKFNRAA